MRNRRLIYRILLSALLISTALPQAANAQGLQTRLENYRVSKEVSRWRSLASTRTLPGSTSISTPSTETAPDGITAPDAITSTSAASAILPRPQWFAVAQIIPAPAPENPSPQITSNVPVEAARNAARRRRELSVYTDLQFGYDKQQVLVSTPAPFLADVRRQIRNLVVTAQYPLAKNTNVAVSVPYISQTTRGSTPTGSFTQRGSGVGDIGVYLEKRFPEVARGTDVSVTVGMLFPTGKDPFEIGPDRLPTGLGFYQPLARVRVSKMRVPVQFYGAVDYGTSLLRNIGGQRRRLPASYGAELGFYYAISPEFTTQTAVKWSRVSSPFTFESDSNVAYLSQALIYTASDATAFQAAVDAGLTDDAIDFFLSLSLVKHF